jgi:hypothetical protein
MPLPRSCSLVLAVPFFVASVTHCSSSDSPSSTSPDAATADAGAGSDAESTCTPPTGSGTEHAGNVESDQTWTAAGSPHVVTTSVFVKNGATLTIEPCAEVRLAKGQSIEVASVPTDTTGSLEAKGTATQPIRFVGQNGDRWGHLFVRVPGGKATLRYVTLEGGGGDLETMHATLFVRGPGEWPSRRDVLVDHVTIKSSLGYGAVVDRAAAFAEGSSDLTVTDSGKGDTDRAFPLRVGEGAIHTLPSGSYKGNAVDEILIYEDAVLPGSGLREDATMRDLGVPYRVGDGTNKRLAIERSPITNAVSTLTIQPGVHIRFLPNSWLSVHNQNADEEAGGAIVAVGTPDKPIVLTSTSATPQKGDWVGVWFGGRPLAKNRLENVRIEYAGGDCLCGLSTCSAIADHDAAVMMHYEPAAGFSITSSTIASSASHGVNRGWKGASTQSFLPTNTFVDITGCKQTLPVPADGTCPAPQPACE